MTNNRLVTVIASLYLVSTAITLLGEYDDPTKKLPVLNESKSGVMQLPSKDTLFTEWSIKNPYISLFGKCEATLTAPVTSFERVFNDESQAKNLKKYINSFAHVQVSNDTVTIQPRQGNVGFVTTNGPQVAVGGESYHILARMLNERHRNIHDSGVDPIFEAYMTQSYTFDMYRKDSYDGLGYGPKVGSLVLRVVSLREFTGISLAHTTVKTDSTGIQSTEKIDLVYPTYLECAQNSASWADIFTRQPHESDKTWQKRAAVLKKCLYTPKRCIVESENG